VPPARVERLGDLCIQPCHWLPFRIHRCHYGNVQIRIGLQCRHLLSLGVHPFRDSEWHEYCCRFVRVDAQGYGWGNLSRCGVRDEHGWCEDGDEWRGDGDGHVAVEHGEFYTDRYGDGGNDGGGFPSAGEGVAGGGAPGGRNGGGGVYAVGAQSDLHDCGFGGDWIGGFDTVVLRLLLLLPRSASEA